MVPNQTTAWIVTPAACLLAWLFPELAAAAAEATELAAAAICQAYSSACSPVSVTGPIQTTAGQ